MSETRVLQLLGRAGALISQSHIVYTSGKHGSDYVNKDALYVYPHYTSEIARIIAGRFDAIDDSGVEVVVGPAMGGIILGQWVAYHLEQWNKARTGTAEILSVYAEKKFLDKEKKEFKFAFGRGYEKLVPGKRVLVVEDILNTGVSSRRIVEAVREAGGSVVGLGAILNRGKITPADAGVPYLECGASISMPSYEEEECPLCKTGIPINTEIGHGAEFLANKLHAR